MADENKNIVLEEQYQKLEKKFKSQGDELDKYKKLFEDVSPILEKLNDDPELAKAILEDKIDSRLVESVFSGKIDKKDSGQKHCSQCGFVIPKSDKFCVNCGEEITKRGHNIGTIDFIKVNDFLYKKFEELFFPLEEFFGNVDNIKLSNRAINNILYELFFFFIYTIHSSGKYSNDMHLKDLFQRFSSFFKSPLNLKIEDYADRFSEIDETMKLALMHAQNSGGVGGAMVGFAIHKLPDSLLNEIIIDRDNNLEKLFNIDVDSDTKEDIFIYLPLIFGLMVGEMNIKFAKDVENYFKKNKVE
ncbi:MAG: hypothetical protein GWO87_02455 [Xanthomonadaceae bacterium]|nr:hypothetical protein [Rhodospirillaceae bacterium]NIA18026.1 hypothetical protein [Xanthomonadaceae bacterium]